MPGLVNQAGAVVQQSLTLDPSDYTGFNVSKSYLGIVLAVHPSDSDSNRSAIQTEDRRGYCHTATVLVINSLRGQYMLLGNVIITPDARSGLDDYMEHLPRPCSTTIDGNAWDSSMSNVDPNSLDGDWCVVSFLDGNIDSPYISRWWPHPRNPFDPATSGKRNPSDRTADPYLVQSGRYFHRINGVEIVVTEQGDVYVSTCRANSSLVFGQDRTPDEGRFPRNTDEENGGSIKLWVKPSQSFELDFNKQQNRLGVQESPENQLPQTNPAVRTASARKDNTYILLEKDRVSFTVPEEISLVSKKRLLLNTDEETKITVGSDLTQEISGNSKTTVSGDTESNTTGSTTITSTGTITVSSQDSVTITGNRIVISGVPGGSSGIPGSLEVSASGVTLGDGSAGGVVTGTALVNALLTFASSIATASSSAADTGFAVALANAAYNLTIAVNTTAVSRTTKTG